MKVLYKPIGLVLGILSGIVGKKLFDFVWTKIDDEEPPEGHDAARATGSRSSPRRRCRAMIFKSTRVVVDRYGAVGWNYLTGSWPGEKRPDPDE